MITRKSLLSALAVTTTVVGFSTPSTQAYAQANQTYHCDGTAAQYYPAVRDAARAKAKNIAHIRYFYKLVEIWDANYIREGCKAFLDGKSYNDSCLNGRRPLDQIAEEVPDGFYGLALPEALKLQTKLQQNTDYQEAFKFCRANGFYK